MRPIPTTRSLVPALALLTATVLLVSCGTGVSGTAAPGSMAAGSATSTSSPDAPPAVSMSTVTTPPSTPTQDVPGTAVSPAPVPSVSVPDVPVPSVSVPSVSVPSVSVPSVPSPPVPDPEPEPDPPAGTEPVPVDPDGYWAPAVDAYAWTSPSGNILCLLRPDDPSVGCAVFDHTIAPADDCFPDQPFVAELSGGSVVQGCTGDVPYSGEVLAYGDSITVGGLTCSSAQEGMVCDDGDVAFLLSRNTLDLAG